MLIVISCFGILSGFTPSATSQPGVSFYTSNSSANVKLAAFNILKAKCNGCHVRQNSTKVFTTTNMNSLAQNIHEQVFIRKRMPRGNRVRLTEAEYNILRSWLMTQNIK